jgi:hypothetical protein
MALLTDSMRLLMSAAVAASVHAPLYLTTSWVLAVAMLAVPVEQALQNRIWGSRIATGLSVQSRSRGCWQHSCTVSSKNLDGLSSKCVAPQQQTTTAAAAGTLRTLHLQLLRPDTF